MVSIRYFFVVCDATAVKLTPLAAVVSTNLPGTIGPIAEAAAAATGAFSVAVCPNAAADISTTANPPSTTQPAVVLSERSESKDPRICLVFAVILSAAKDPDASRIPTTARTFLPRIPTPQPAIIRSISPRAILELSTHTSVPIPNESISTDRLTQTDTSGFGSKKDESYTPVMQEADTFRLGSAFLVPPKAFISYSWTSPGHQGQVRLWAERLLNDGIEVIVDVFDLKEGHDKYFFMERMVVDPDITHVLVFSDRAYAEKADARQAGVGTESQIISSGIYAKVDQSKFIPIVCEFAEDSDPCLPVFLKSRIWIDFSSQEAANQNWEKLVRLLYNKPLNQKPKIGRTPAYILIRP
jgi:hypothetical protein